MMMRKYALLALSALALTSVLLPGCGSKSNEETPAPTKDGAMSNKSASTVPTTPGAATTPGASSTATGTLDNPQPPEGTTK